MNNKVETSSCATKVSSRIGNKYGIEPGRENEYIRDIPPIKVASEFVVACKNGDVHMAKFWWDKNPSIIQFILTDLCYEDDLFYVICERGYLQLAKWIISTNHNFISNIVHEHLMVDVCLAGKISVAKWLLTLSPNILVDEDIVLLFRKVCKRGHLNMAKWLANMEPKIMENGDLCLAFWESCAKGKLNVAKWLYSISSEEVYSLEKDTVDYEEKLGMFIQICTIGHIAVVKWLLTIMPTINDEDDIRTMFHHACMSGHLNIAKCLFKSYPNTNISAYDDHTFRMVCSWGRLHVAKWLLKIKPDIDISTEDNHAFQEACENGHLDIAKWLLHMKPDIDITVDVDGAFESACKNGHLEVAKWLLYMKPDIDISLTDVINSTTANIDVVKWLFKVIPHLYHFKYRFNLSNAFELSCFTGNLELVTLIFEKQEEYITDRSLITSGAFSGACVSGNMELINWLLAQFSNIDLSINNELPFINACTNGHFMLAKRLLELKPDINISANDDKAFKQACRNGHVDVFRWLENMFPEKYSVGQPIYLGNGLEYDSDDEEYDELSLNIAGELSTNYTYSYIVFKYINITRYILKQDIPKKIDDCSICLDSQSNVYTNCSHMYCKPCISKWLKTHDTCPCCREELEDENMANIIV
jgi:ankyrin repeat protein